MATGFRKPEFDQTKIIEKFRDDLEETKKQNLSRLATLVEQSNPVELFVGTLASMMFGLPEEMTEANFGTSSIKSEILAYELYPFIENSKLGKKEEKDSSIPHPCDIQGCKEILERLLLAYSFNSFSKSKDEDDILSFIRGRAQVVRGNAYPPQTQRRILSVQGKFDKWFESKVGICPTRVIEILKAIWEHEEESFNNLVGPELIKTAKSFADSWHSIHKKNRADRTEDESLFIRRLKTSNEARNLGVATVFGFVTEEYLPVEYTKLGLSITDEEWEALISLIGLTSEKRMKMKEPVEVRNYPLFVLPDKRVLLLDFSNTLDVLWEAFDNVARQDQNFYDKRYQKHAAHWLEDQAVRYLSKVFPDGHVYRTLDYPDLEKEPGSTTELDIAVEWGPFLLLVEAKAKQFRLEGQLGDVGRLRTDLKLNIEEAFEQSLRARKYIEAVENAVFKERKTEREIILNKERYKRIYHLTVSLHGLSTLTTRLTAVKPLGLFKGNDYPFAVGEADLEILSELLPGPEVFLHYVEKRIALHRVSPFVTADEIDLLGAYFDSRFVNQLWDNPENNYSMIGLDGYSSEIDTWARNHWKNLQESCKIKLAIPEEIRKLISYLRTQTDDNARWIAFCILDLPLDALKSIAEGLEKAHKDPPQIGVFRRFVASGDNNVICIVVSNGQTVQELKQNLEKRVAIEKYRRRVQKAIGFGISTNDTNPFTVAVWEDADWEPNPELEILVENDIPGVPLPGMKIPGRNDPCLCGSGKKYKKCCLEKIELARKLQKYS